MNSVTKLETIESIEEWHIAPIIYHPYYSEKNVSEVIAEANKRIELSEKLGAEKERAKNKIVDE